jgi:hypothetical protein
MLIPNLTFVLEFLLALAVLGVVWVWPLIHVARRHEWGWCIAILLLGPLAALVWFVWTRIQPPSNELPQHAV